MAKRTKRRSAKKPTRAGPAHRAEHKNTQEPVRWLSIAEAAAAVMPAITADAMRKWCSAGLPFERTGGGAREIRIKLADLVRFVAKAKPRYSVTPAMLASPASAGAEGSGAGAGDGIAAAQAAMGGQGDPRRAFESALRLGDARAAREDLRRRTDEIRLQKQLGELVSAAEVERVWSAQIGAFGRGLAKLPDTCMPGLARAVGAMLEGLGVPANKAAPAVEGIKAAFRAEVQQATDIIRQGLSEHPASDQEQGDGQEDE